MPRITMRATRAGPIAPYLEGGVYDVPPEIAAQFVDSGEAVLTDVPPVVVDAVRAPITEPVAEDLGVDDGS